MTENGSLPSDVSADSSSASEATERPTVRDSASLRERARQHLSRSPDTAPKSSLKASKASSTEDYSSDTPEAAETSDVSDSDSRSSQEQKQEMNPAISKLKSRVDKVTAKFHQASRDLAETKNELAKRDKAIEILQQEVARLSKGRQFDPKEEQIRQLQLEKEVNEWQSQLNPDKFQEEYLSKANIDDQVEEILDTVKTISSKYQLVSPQEILLAMQKDNRDPEVIAKELHNKRIQLAGGSVKAPKSVGTKGETSADRPAREYSRKSMTEFFESKIAERNGKVRY